ncbi:MAG: tRNA (adenosine(37)-N6)-dimethylallyltransferase MiaA [Thermoleophilia bacterium]|nr:tRNA (adenosine(37)-N6)-dimethylallyltransferase MiaA [Thermoleophilia bacterium]
MDGDRGTGAARSDPLSAIAADLAGRPGDWPVVLAGPTASGKSDLALRLADRCGGVIVNADAIQVWSCWRVLSARPSPADEAAARHELYGYVAPGEDYSVGRWLRDLGTRIAGLRQAGLRPIIVGGTGLYVSALTGGLAEIPPTPPHIRTEAAERLSSGGLGALLAGLDPETAARIDRRNPARVARAWEVLQTTGRGLAIWQDETGPPLLPLAAASAFVLDADRDWLARRIDRRFDLMLRGGAIEEVREILPVWSPAATWAQAIGAREIVEYLGGRIDAPTLSERGKAASRQYAKRQRTWFRARMGKWRHLLA